MFGLLHQLILFLVFIAGLSSNSPGNIISIQKDSVYIEKDENKSDNPERLPFDSSLKFETEETNGEWLEKIDFQAAENTGRYNSNLFLQNDNTFSLKTSFFKSRQIRIFKKRFLYFLSLLI
jgi:hypothetical protein